MGNNTSQIRKSSISYNESNVRKSSTSKSHNQNLDEEFSDLILHEVKKDQSGQQRNKFDKFSNELIEDEFNELNDLIETDTSEVSRNIIQDDNKNNDMELEGSGEGTLDDMEIDSLNPEINSSFTPTPDLSTVDFAKVMSNQTMGGSRQTQPIQQMGTLPNRAQPYSGISSPSNYSFNHGSSGEKLVSVEIKWVNITKENIQKIAIIGSFSNWRNIIRLKPSTTHSNEFVVTVKLPLGVHKLLYIINNEYRVSEQLPTATDQEGIFFNWFEVLDDQHLFNHSQNQPNRTNASTKYDANIIQAAGQFEINEIQKKSNSFLTRISKEEPNFEHVEYSKDVGNSSSSQGIEHSSPRPIKPVHPPAYQPPPPQAQLNPISPESFSGPYISMSDNTNTSSSFLLNQEAKKLEYSSEIPEIFVNYNYFKSQHDDFELPEPPQLPAHLNNVLLNKLSNSSSANVSNHQHTNHSSSHSSSLMGLKPPSASFDNKRPPLRRADSSYYASNQEAYHLSIPNHVILNHLMTTSIRNDVLTVACITRYSGKFVTQIMHSPADT